MSGDYTYEACNLSYIIVLENKRAKASMDRSRYPYTMTDDTGDTMFVNEVQAKPISPGGMTMGAPPHYQIAIPASGYTAATPHPHAKPSSRHAVTSGWTLYLWLPRNKV